MISDSTEKPEEAAADAPVASAPEAAPEPTPGDAPVEAPGAATPESGAAEASDLAGQAAAEIEAAPAADADAPDDVSDDASDDAASDDSASDDSASDDADDAEDDAPVTPEPDEADRIRALFTRSAAGDAAEAFRFARWDGPVAPRLFGVEGEGAEGILAGIGAAAKRAGVELVDEVPDFGANLLMFFCDEWRDLLKTPGIERLVPDIAKLVAMLGATGANQYHIYSFAPEGAVQLVVALIRYDEEMARLSARAIGLSQATHSLLLWSDTAFTGEGPLAVNRRGEPRLKPWFGDLLAAAYDPATPAASEDPALAEALAMGVATRRATALKAAAKSKRRGAKRDGPRRGRGRDKAADPETEGQAAEAPSAEDAAMDVAASSAEAAAPETATLDAETTSSAPPSQDAEAAAAEDAPAKKAPAKRRTRRSTAKSSAKSKAPDKTASKSDPMPVIDIDAEARPEGDAADGPGEGSVDPRDASAVGG